MWPSAPQCGPPGCCQQGNIFRGRTPRGAGAATAGVGTRVVRETWIGRWAAAGGSQGSESDGSSGGLGRRLSLLEGPLQQLTDVNGGLAADDLWRERIQLCRVHGRKVLLCEVRALRGWRGGLATSPILARPKRTLTALSAAIASLSTSHTTTTLPLHHTACHDTYCCTC